MLTIGRNVMRLAHLTGKDNVNPDGTKCVDQIPIGRNGQPLSPDAGVGTWKQDNPIFHYFLGTPNVRPLVQMLMDHNPSFSNPYITAIHTIPRILGILYADVGSNARTSDTRETSILLVLGGKPMVAGTSAASIDEGTVGTA